MKGIIAVIVLLFAVTVTKADSVWTYQGNNVSGQSWLMQTPDGGAVLPPNPCNCSLSGFMVFSGDIFANVFTPVAWTFTDGLDTLTQSNSTVLEFNAFESGKDPGTLPFQGGWHMDLVGANFTFTSVSISPHESWDRGPSLSVLGNQGKWTEVANIPTPEPSSLMLLTGALALLALAGLKQHA